jgi:hypothetical protein
MLRRNRPVTFSEIRPSGISWTKFLPARSCHSASAARCADLICWTHFCSSHISKTLTKPHCSWITFFLLYEVLQWTHFSSFLLPGSQRVPGAALFLHADPVFLIPFRATPTGADSSLMRAPPARSHRFLRWTHFYSFRLIDEELSLHAVDFTRRFTGLRDIGIQEAPQKGGFVFRLVPPTS